MPFATRRAGVPGGIASKQTTGWVDERGGKPARVEGTGSGDDPGDEWLSAFDAKELALDETADDEASRFNKLVSR
jgi:hypothetical protein